MGNSLERKQQQELIKRENALFLQELEKERTKQKARALGQETRNNIAHAAKTGIVPSTNPSPKPPEQGNNGLGFFAILTVVCIIALIVFLLSKCSTSKEAVSSPIIPVTESSAKQTNQTQMQQQTFPTENFFTDGMVFPESSIRFLTDDEIASIRGNETYSRKDIIQFAINELYARHHISFQTEFFKNYYSSFSWYWDGGVTAEEAISQFNTFESHNLDKLVSARKG